MRCMKRRRSITRSEERALLPNSGEHLIRNNKFRAAHGHRCNIAFVEANHNLVVLIQVEGSVVCDGGKIPFRHIGIEPVDFIFICRHLFFHLLFDIVADSG